jgi:tetratricopeptide (TPR) repeat protein
MAGVIQMRGGNLQAGIDKTKKKCVVCTSARGKRICRIREQAPVCPGCCAGMRNPECSGCSYYADAEKYGIEKMKNSSFRDFTAQIDPEIDKAIENALKLAEKGNIPKAEALLTGLKEKHPDIYKVQYGMGTLHAMKGNFRESVFFLGKSLEQFPYFIEAWFNKAVAHKNLGDLGNSIRSFRKVIEFGEREHHLVIKARKFIEDTEKSISRNFGLPLDRYLESMDLFEQASVLMQNKEYEKAIDGFQNVLTVNKYHPQSYGNLGLCYSLLGKREEALSAFNMALAIDPMYKPALTNRAILLNLPEGEKMPDDYIKKVDFYKGTGEEEQ